MADPNRPAGVPHPPTGAAPGAAPAPPTPPPPAPPPPPAAPPPAAGAPAAPGAGAKLPMPLILGGAAGVALLVVIIIFIATRPASYKVPGVSPALDEPKTAAETYLKFRWEKAWNGQAVAAARQSKELGEREAKAKFYEDPDLYLKENIKKPKARADALDANEGQMEEAKITVGSPEGTDERKTVKYTIEFKDLRKKGDKEGDDKDHYELKDEKLEGTLTFALIGGQWRLVEAGGDGFIVPRSGRGED